MVKTMIKKRKLRTEVKKVLKTAFFFTLTTGVIYLLVFLIDARFTALGG